MSKLAKEVVEYFEGLYSSQAQYVWGMNGDVIDDNTIAKAMNANKSAMYNSAYYANKLAVGRGKIGADCSGAFCKMSGYDATAQTYYNRTESKGEIQYIDRNKVCLVFKGKNATSINHIGLYCGNGYTIEMQSSTTNCVKKKLDDGKWKYFGIPTWINYNVDIKAVDISQYNTIKNWQALSGEIKDIIIRIGRRGSSNGQIVADTKFEEYFTNAINCGMNVGVYFYDQAINEIEAIEEADWVISKLGNRRITLPVYIDSEYANKNHNGRADNISINQRTKNIIAFCDRINTKYVAGVYASNSWFNSMLDFNSIRHYEIWCARYSSEAPTIAKYDAWQYGSENYSWATAPIDTNHFYKEYNSNSVYTSNAINLIAETPIQIMGIVTGNNVNVRKRPDTISDICDKRYKGDWVQINAQTSNGWYKIGDERYIHGDYVKYISGIVYNCNKLFVRSTPDKTKDDNKLTFITTGTPMYIVGRTEVDGDVWYQALLADNLVGWVSGKYIKVS